MVANKSRLLDFFRALQYVFFFGFRMDRGGLVVRSRLWDGGFEVPNPIPLKIRRVWGLLHAKSDEVAKRPPVCVVRKFGEGCRPRHLTMVQNYEVRPKITLVLLQNGTLN
ncbi:hypothetical protein AVEN_150936-1 [Araneus ventricosus]|uniref:Uncharacterized protein n=1 Tax=Araneus ventricosus TaxID=182803 RepID=A0A4Y2VI96_ARAVE|nr:hypothetical protein AVEN_244473-1 [Araneus ventricosus]GBO25131.1 hypothetical protein AVEN_133150-1 [Araneus ventricosus]GBO35461.1 hypothetical protein AVEN_56602-1 [Araneus ventricosus]GBO35462.1 hypothetical protein AVEN_150936-1 [Araneus ventricosus]